MGTAQYPVISILEALILILVSFLQQRFLDHIPYMQWTPYHIFNPLAILIRLQLLFLQLVIILQECLLQVQCSFNSAS